MSALGGYLSVRITFQGEGLDRLRDSRHAALVELMVKRLEALEWAVATEVSFNVYGERGSIDILAFHAATRTLLVIEVKTVIPDVGGMLAAMDRKLRLASDIASRRGWRTARVARLLVVPEASTVRRRVRDHEATFANAFPARNVEVNAWLRAPAGPMSGLVLLSDARHASNRHGQRPDLAPTSAPPRTRRQ